MSDNGGKRIHHLRPARELSQVPPWEPRLAGAGTGTSSEANGNVQRSAASTAVSHAIVELVRTRTGRAPTEAKTEMASDLAIVTFGNGLTESEKTLSEVRNGLCQAMRTDAIAAVEAITGRQVAAYLTDQQHHSDLSMIAFVFGPRAGPDSGFRSPTASEPA